MRNYFKIKYLWLAVELMTLLGPGQSKATTLDWNNVDWTPTGSLSQSFEIDSDNAGDDITITITGDTGKLDSSSPNDTTDLTGGLGSSEESLFLYANRFKESKKTQESVTVTITFNYAAGVDHVNFLLFDIDRNSNGDWIDQVRNITGSFGSTNYAAFITGSANNVVAGTGTTQTITGTAATGSASGDGNALINFGNAVITSVSFTYGNAPGTDVQSQQFIGLHDIRYRPVPEVSPAWAAIAVCGLAIGIRRRRRAQAA